MKIPQPYQEIEHTADLGVIVRGATAEETLERLVCVMGQLLAGRNDDEPSIVEPMAVAGGAELALLAVDVLREILFRFATRRILPASCRTIRIDRAGAELEVGFASWDAQAHAAGADIKAVTYHQAAFERDGEGWVARMIFDI